MKAVVYNKAYKPVNLMVCDVEKPVPADHEVLVKVKAVAVNAADYRSMKMGMIPKKKIFGADIAGRVVDVGTNCRQFNVGDEVIGELSTCGFGGFAEYAVAPEKLLVHKPVTLTDQAAAALPISAITALQGLRDKGTVQPGQQVLIYGGGGGVGTFSIQLAKYYGAEVTVVCGTKHIDQSIALGADFTIDYTKADMLTTDRKYDLIVGINGGRRISDYKRVMKSGGKVVMVGGSLVQLFKSLLFGWFYSLGSKKVVALAAKTNQEDLAFLAKLAADGTIKPVFDRSFSLAEGPEAVQYTSEGHASGKVIITCP